MGLDGADEDGGDVDESLGGVDEDGESLAACSSGWAGPRTGMGQAWTGGKIPTRKAKPCGTVVQLSTANLALWKSVPQSTLCGTLWHGCGTAVSALLARSYGNFPAAVPQCHIVPIHACERTCVRRAIRRIIGKIASRCGTAP